MPKIADVLVGLPDGDHVLLRNWRQAGDAEWVYAEAEIRCQTWHGQVRVAFYSGELSEFAEQIKNLYKALRGGAVLHPIEPYLVMTLTGDGRGGIEVDGAFCV